MKALVKKLTQPGVLSMLGMVAIAAVAMFAPEMAFAGRADIKGIVGDNIFKDVITLAFGIYAFVKWIDYISDFSPNSALPRLIVPALATFMAFKWTMVLGWFKLV